MPLILRLRQEREIASVVVTHDVHSARTVADRVALMRDGGILIEGTFEDLQKSHDQFVLAISTLWLLVEAMSKAFRVGLLIVATL